MSGRPLQTRYGLDSTQSAARRTDEAWRPGLGRHHSVPASRAVPTDQCDGLRTIYATGTDRVVLPPHDLTHGKGDPRRITIDGSTFVVDSCSNSRYFITGQRRPAEDSRTQRGFRRSASGSRRLTEAKDSWQSRESASDSQIVQYQGRMKQYDNPRLWAFLVPVCTPVISQWTCALR
jgi:hypothetical protein